MSPAKKVDSLSAAENSTLGRTRRRSPASRTKSGETNSGSMKGEVVANTTSAGPTTRASCEVSNKKRGKKRAASNEEDSSSTNARSSSSAKTKSKKSKKPVKFAVGTKLAIYCELQQCYYMAIVIDDDQKKASGSTLRYVQYEDLKTEWINWKQESFKFKVVEEPEAPLPKASNRKPPQMKKRVPYGENESGELVEIVSLVTDE